MRRQSFLLALFLLLALASTSAFATDWFVATDGSDSNAGTIGAPFATLQEAVMDHAQPGDTVYVRSGTYTSMQNINGDGYCSIQAPDHAVIGGAPGSPITIRPYDGDFTAQFTGSLKMVRCKYLVLTGLDMKIATGDGHPLMISSGCNDYLDPAKRSHHIEVTNCRIHDVPGSGQLKVQNSDYIYIHDCDVYNGVGQGGAAFDGVWDNHCTWSRNYLHNTFSGGFVKGGSLYNVFEQNVMVNPAANQYHWGFNPGGCTLQGSSDPNYHHQSGYTVVRNNIVQGATRGGVATQGSDYSYVYNNLYVDCAEMSSGFSYVTALVTPQSCFDNETYHFYVFNNIFYDSDGDMRPYGSVLSSGGNGHVSGWESGNNCFYNNGQSLVYESDTPNPTTESGATYGNPNLTMSGTPTTWQGWVNYYRPACGNSQSNAMLKDRGTSAAGAIPYPAVLHDIEGNGRPKDSGWDIGPYEYQGSAVTPVADFAANAQGVNGQQQWATPPAAFDFTDLSSGGPTSWSWTFGDNSSSTAQNPSHTYSSYGQYTVALTATNSAGYDTETKTNYLTVKPLNAAFTASVTTGNVTQVVNFTDQFSNSPTAWSWTFGDGNSSTVQSPSHTYTDDGTYTVVLTATNAGGNDTCTKTDYITINPFQANFTASPTWGLPSLAVTFTDTSLNSATAWSWTFGDGGTSTAQNPSHTYTTSGYYSVALDASNAYGSDTETKTNYIVVCSSYVYVYPTAYVMGVPGGGNQHVDSGTLSDVQSGTGNGMVFSCDTATQYHGCNWCNITWTAPTGYTPSQIAGITLDWQTKAGTGFTDICGKQCPWPDGQRYASGQCAVGDMPNTFTLYSWTQSEARLVADGLLDTSGNVTFNECHMPGIPANRLTEDYTVSVNLVRWKVFLNPTGGGQAPVAAFSGTPTSGAAPLNVSFTDSSTNTPTSWSWSFGDSATSTAQNPSHTYSSAGSYTVALTATNASGSDGETKTNYITVSVPAPVANFSGTPTSGLQPLEVDFTDSSTNTPTSWSWSFGDSSTSTAQNPSHTYSSAGTYTVSLTAANAGGSDGETKTDYITVTNTVSFAPTSMEVAPARLVSGTVSDLATSNDSYVILSDDPASQRSCYMKNWWSTGYAPSGIVHLKVEYELHSTRADTPTGLLHPYWGDESLNADAVFFNTPPGTSDVWWTWETDAVAHYLYDDGTFGIYICSCGRDVNYDYQISYDCARVTLTLGNGSAAPAANFTGTPTSGAIPLQVSFTDTSTNSPTSWHWNFGDWYTSTSQNPSHTYTSAGSRTVSVTATNGGGSNTCTKANYITATAVNAPVADFTADVTLGVASLAVSFTDSSTNTPTSWSWSFGDSSTSTAQNPSHTYTSAGYYTVSLTATNAGGSDGETKTDYITACTEVTVYPTSWEYIMCAPSTLVSGSISDVQSDNDTYMVFDPEVGQNQHSSRFRFYTAYAPADVAKMILDAQWKGSQAGPSGTPNYDTAIQRTSGQGYETIKAFTFWYNTDHDYSWSATSISDYMDANGDWWVDICGCPQNGNSYTTSIDLMRVKLWIKP